MPFGRILLQLFVEVGIENAYSIHVYVNISFECRSSQAEIGERVSMYTCALVCMNDCS